MNFSKQRAEEHYLRSPSEVTMATNYSGIPTAEGGSSTASTASSILGLMNSA